MVEMPAVADEHRRGLRPVGAWQHGVEIRRSTVTPGIRTATGLLAGCPEQTVADLIGADNSEAFRRQDGVRGMPLHGLLSTHC